MKIFYLKFIIVGLLLSLFPATVMAQRSNGIAVEGKITVQQGLVEGAIIQMFIDGRRMDNYGVGTDGQYKVELTYNHKFELIFTLKGNFSQKIAVDASVPKEVLQTDPRFPPFPLNINLFTEIPGIDKSFVDNTILKIYYNKNVDNFVSELYYNDAQIAKLIEQAKLQGQQIGKVSDYLSKLTRAELAELRKEYNSLLSQADKQYSGEQFLAALDGYKAASKVFPNEQFPKDRIAEINDLLGLMMVAAELDKALADRFDLLIKEADQLMMQKNYTDARNSYNRALSIKPNDNYTNQQVNLINDLLKKQMADEQYNIIIAQADNSFKQLLYNEALKSYQEALSVKPNESYPKNKLKEINEILASETKNAEKQESYKQAMQQGEIMFQKQFYEKALASFDNALSLKPGDEPATRKIEEVKGIMNRLADKLMYDKLIASADKSYKKDLLKEALPDYVSAAAIIPDDKYATQRIEEINQKLQLAGNFTDLIAKADNEFNTKNYNEAKSLYQEALKIRSTDKYSLDRVREIDVLLAAQGVEEKYNTAITQADGLFNTSDYENAKGKYNEAASIKPKEKYPKDKILEINNILSQITKNNQTYQQTVAKADGLFNQKSYEKAKEAFVEAGRIKPEETYPAEMIVKIDGLIAEQTRLAGETAAAEAARLAAIQAEKDKNYSEAITKADNLFNEKNYQNARNEYRTAQTVKPEETYPQQRITEIGTLMAQLSAAQKVYEDAVAKGDREFKAEKFDAAKLAYNDAQKAKPEETYPGEQIAKIDSTVETRARLAAEAEAEKVRLAQEASAAEATRLAAIQAEKDKNYNEAITKADNFFNERNYESARNEYRTAQTVKPGETYPQQRITEIGTLMAQLSAAQKAYEDAVAKGDREFKAEKFDAAKLAYNDAQKAKPEESYPGEQIAKIDSTVETRVRLAAEAEAERIRLAEEAAATEAARLASIQAEKNKNYNEAITKADNFFNGRNYESARNEYRTAQTVKPGETYPQQRITEIGTLMAQLSAAQKAYEDAVAKGDREFKAEKFDAAKLAYNDAQKAKPEESYPGEQIAKIDSTVETRVRLAAEAEAERIRLAEEAAATEAARLASIQAEKNKNYNEAITKADNFFNGRNYESARNEYRTAQTVKPGETYPQQRITEIGTLMAQLSAAQKAYEDAVAKGDREFKAEKFDAAKLAYNDAQKAKPDETYPGEQIAKIDSTVETRVRLAAEAEAEKVRLAQEASAAEATRLAAIQAEKNKNYNEAIAKADNLFNEKQYENARNEYRTALTAKPQETYPQQKIDEIGKTLAALEQSKKQQELLDRNYANAIQQADRFFVSKTYDQSKGKYNEALTLKPEESYPKDRIAEITRILEQQVTDEKYRVIIVAADGFFKTEKYLQAKTEYEKALTVKAEEQYPKNQITKIDDILQKEQQRILAEKKSAEDIQRRSEEIAKLNRDIEARGVASDAELKNIYDQYIRQADESFGTKMYVVSRGWYYKAWDVKPEENYPKQRIDEINRLLKGLLSSQLDRDYQRFVDLADSTFRDNQYAVSRGWYNRALGVKATEQYPKDQIKEIENKIAERMAGQSGQQFETDVQKAAAAFEAKNYNVSRFWYKRALELRPDDVDTKNRLKEIDEVLKK
jgi:tetratricopeptide (TPR) repeat protein